MGSVKNYARGTVFALFCIALGSLLTRSSIHAAPSKSTAPTRGFYLTTTAWAGNQPTLPGVCAAGYHFASMWEIADPSNLRYEAGLGLASDDDGSGPPSGFNGWVRTGALSFNDGAGHANCNAWTSNSNTDRGSMVYLNNEWLPQLNIWNANTLICSDLQHVWCVQD